MPIATAIVITLVTYAVFGATAASETSGPFARDAYYNRLVDGFRKGHLYLDKEAPAGLLALPDPYDRTTNYLYRGSTYTADGIHDLTLFRGKLYLYFSAVPAVLIFWPCHFLTGHYLSQQAACFVCTSFAFLIGTALLLSIRERYFRRTSEFTLGLLVLAFGLAPLTPVLLQRPDVYEVPISCAYLFTMAALWCAWRLLDANSKLVRWSAGLSVCVALAISSRPNEILLVGLLGLPIWRVWRRRQKSTATQIGKLVPTLLATAMPLGFVGCALLLYNYERFGRVFEFGNGRYQLNGDPNGTVLWDARYLAGNIWEYFCHYAGWTKHFPFAGGRYDSGINHDAIGILPSAPFVVCAGLVFVFLRPLRPKLRVMVAAAGGIAATNALILCFFLPAPPAMRRRSRPS